MALFFWRCEIKLCYVGVLDGPDFARAGQGMFPIFAITSSIAVQYFLFIASAYHQTGCGISGAISKTVAVNFASAWVSGVNGAAHISVTNYRRRFVQTSLNGEYSKGLRRMLVGSSSWVLLPENSVAVRAYRG